MPEYSPGASETSGVGQRRSAACSSYALVPVRDKAPAVVLPNNSKAAVAWLRRPCRRANTRSPSRWAIQS